LIIYQKNEKAPIRFLTFYIDIVYKNNDFEFFEKQIVNCLKNYGLDLSHKNYYFLSFNIELRDGKLKKWYDQIYNTNYLIWLKENYKKLQVVNRINSIWQKDQLARQLLYSCQFVDSLRLLEYVDKQIAVIDFNNLTEIIEICKEEGGIIPNDIDYPDVLGKIEIIILHNLKSNLTIDTTWKMIYPYFENTFLKNKMNNDLCKLYDKWLYKYHNVQYYGTLNDGIPVIEPENLLERKKKFKL
jgi:hypothetical protein